MFVIQLNRLPLRTTWTATQPKQRVHSTFPFLFSQENKAISLVYYELNPGDYLGLHKDSAEEVLFIFEGTVQMMIGNERTVVKAPALALVPRLVSHNLQNVGDCRVKAAAFFPQRHVVSTFEHAWMPENAYVIDTEQLAQTRRQTREVMRAVEELEC